MAPRSIQPPRGKTYVVPLKVPRLVTPTQRNIAVHQIVNCIDVPQPCLVVQLPNLNEVGTDCNLIQVMEVPAIASSPHLVVQDGHQVNDAIDSNMDIAITPTASSPPPVVHDGHQVDDANDINMDIAIPPSADLPFVHDEDSVSHQANSLSRIDHIDWSHIDQLADNSDAQVAPQCAMSSNMDVCTLVPDEGRSHRFSVDHHDVAASIDVSSAATTHQVINGSTTQLRSKVATNMTWIGSSARLRTYLERGNSSSKYVRDGLEVSPASNFPAVQGTASRPIPEPLPPAKRRRKDQLFLEAAVEGVRSMREARAKPY